METELLLHCLERGGIVGVDWVDYAQALEGALVADWDLLGNPSLCVCVKKLCVVWRLR